MENHKETPLTRITDPPGDKYRIEEIQMKLEAGMLGKIFGTDKNAPLNIAGALALILVLSGIATIFFSTQIPSIEFWKIIIPIISMILGYIFGKKA